MNWQSFDADPDPTSYFDADLDKDLALKVKS
jgi:hypothetical protein